MPRIAEERPFDPRRIIGALIRRKLMIVGIMLAGLGLSFVYTNQLTPLYSAHVTVLIEGNRSNVVNIENVAKGLTPDYYTNETQAAVIQSRDIAGKVVDKFNLAKDPDFNPELAPSHVGLLDVALTAVKGWFGFSDEPVIEEDPWAGYSPLEKRAAEREMLIDVFLSGLSVIPSQRALLVEIEHRHSLDCARLRPAPGQPPPDARRIERCRSQQLSQRPGRAGGCYRTPPVDGASLYLRRRPRAASDGSAWIAAHARPAATARGEL